MHVSPHPAWVAGLDRSLEPLQQQILDLPVVVEASENRLAESSIRNFCIEFYPIVRDFPAWLDVLLKRSPPEGVGFFRDNIKVERRHDAMWRAMGDGFGVERRRFDAVRDTNSAVMRFHNFLTDAGRTMSFASAVAATNYAVEGVAQQIASKALEGLQYNEKLGKRGRWWLEEHAKYDDEHPIHALELIKQCIAAGEDHVENVTDAAVRSLELMVQAMDRSYHA